MLGGMKRLAILFLLAAPLTVGCASETGDADRDDAEQAEPAAAPAPAPAVDVDTAKPATSPRDASSGLATGRRQHLPLQW